MNWSQFVLFARNVDSPQMFARCFNLMAFVMESHLTCSFAGHPRQPGCLWHWALRCWRGASSALLARKTNRSRDWRELEDSNVVLIDKLTLAASFTSVRKHTETINASTGTPAPPSLPALQSIIPTQIRQWQEYRQIEVQSKREGTHHQSLPEQKCLQLLVAIIAVIEDQTLDQLDFVVHFHNRDRDR